MLRVALALAVVLLAASCGGDDDGASVSIASPEDGATVASPVEVTMEAEGFTIERVGGVRDGAGHFHLVIDADCLAPGDRIPEDEAHRHLADGASETEVVLSPGAHTLCLQAGDGIHEALDLIDEVTITVTGSGAGPEEAEEEGEREVWEGTMDGTISVIPPGRPGPACPDPIEFHGEVRLVVGADGETSGSVEMTGPCVESFDLTGTKTAAGFRFPVLEPLFAQGPVALVGPERAEGRALHVVAGTTRYVTEWTLRCTSCG